MNSCFVNDRKYGSFGTVEVKHKKEHNLWNVVAYICITCPILDEHITGNAAHH
jgi:hypothetical protein